MYLGSFLFSLWIMDRYDGPPVVGEGPRGDSLDLNGFLCSLLLLFYSPVLSLPPQKVLLRLPWNWFWRNHDVCGCQLGGGPYHICGALNFTTRHSDWTKSGTLTLIGEFNVLQTGAQQWVFWGLQSREGWDYVDFCASRHPLLVTLWRFIIKVGEILRRGNIHIVLLSAGDWQLSLICVSRLFNITCLTNNQAFRDAGV